MNAKLYESFIKNCCGSLHRIHVWLRYTWVLRKPKFRFMNADSNFRILIEQDEDGIFIASAPELPGCISQGKTRKEALSNIEDAVQGYLVSLRKHNESIPLSIIEKMIEVKSSFF